MLAAALEYSNVIFAGAIAYWLLGALTSVVRATGQVAILAYVYVAVEVLHIALVPVLVFGLGPIPALGITGAGLATVISFVASTTTLAWYLASGRTSVVLSLRGTRFERRLFGEILHVGAPMSLAPVLNNVALATITSYAGLLGATSLAAFGAAVRLEYLLYPLNFGLGAAVLAMVGSNIGARQFERAGRIAWITVGNLGLCHGLCEHIRDRRTGALDGPVQPRFGNPCRGRPLFRSSASPMIRRGQHPDVGLPVDTPAGVATDRHDLPVDGGGMGGWIAIQVLHTGLVGLAVVTALGLATWGIVLAGAFRLYARLR